MQRHSPKHVRQQAERWKKRDAETIAARRRSKHGLKSHRLRWGESCSCVTHDGLFNKAMPMLRRADDDRREQLAELIAEED